MAARNKKLTKYTKLITTNQNKLFLKQVSYPFTKNNHRPSNEAHIRNNAMDTPETATDSQNAKLLSNHKIDFLPSLMRIPNHLYS